MTKSRMISGSLITLLGIFLLSYSFFIEELSVILGLFFLVFGVIIIFNKSEDEIEQIKQRPHRIRNFISSKFKKRRGSEDFQNSKNNSKDENVLKDFEDNSKDYSENNTKNLKKSNKLIKPKGSRNKSKGKSKSKSKGKSKRKGNKK